MNLREVLHVVGALLMWTGAAMLVPAGFGVAHEDRIERQRAHIGTNSTGAGGLSKELIRSAVVPASQRPERQRPELQHEQ